MQKIATIIGFLSAIGFVFCTGCRPQWGFHFGPHRYDFQDSFYSNGREYYVFKCVKDCPEISMYWFERYAELTDTSVKQPNP